MWWKNEAEQAVLGACLAFSTLSGSMWWKNEELTKFRRWQKAFQYPLRVNVVEKLYRYISKRNKSSVSVPSPGQCGGKTGDSFCLHRRWPRFQYPLRVNVVEKPFDIFRNYLGSRFQYPLRVNVVEKPFLVSATAIRLDSISVPSPGQCGGKTFYIPRRRFWQSRFQYPLRVNVVEKPVVKIRLYERPLISVPSPGQCGGKTRPAASSPRPVGNISVPSPGQCGGKTHVTPSPRPTEKNISVPSPGQCGGKTPRFSARIFAAQKISVPSPGQCGGKTKRRPATNTRNRAFQYPLRVNVVEKPTCHHHCPRRTDGFQYPLRVNVVEKLDGDITTPEARYYFSTLSGSMWWKNQTTLWLVSTSSSISVPSPGQCGGKTPAIRTSSTSLS